MCCALSPYTGPAASLFLMAMGLALGAKQGPAALTMLAAASISADWRERSIDPVNNDLRQIAVMILAALICGVYLLRQRRFEAASGADGDGREISVEHASRGLHATGQRYCNAGELRHPDSAAP